MFKYDYATSDFQKQPNKASIVAERPLNTSKTIKNDINKMDQKYLTKR